MRIYKIVKKEESLVIPLSKVNLENGFIVVSSEDETIGIIVYDNHEDMYMFIINFVDTFSVGVGCEYSDPSLEGLMKQLKDNYVSPVEFNFIKVEQ